MAPAPPASTVPTSLATGAALVLGPLRDAAQVPPGAWARLRAALLVDQPGLSVQLDIGLAPMQCATAAPPPGLAWMSPRPGAPSPPQVEPEQRGREWAQRPPRRHGPHADGPAGASSARDKAVDDRLAALVDLARDGDAEAFGQLYDHYVSGVYGFVRGRVAEAHLAEDLTAETFFRALRAIGDFTWQGRDFGAWLTAIARNLVADHYKAKRTRLEQVFDEVPEDSTLVVEDTAETALAGLTNQMLWQAMGSLRREQQECLVMRFLQGLSISETAMVLGRSEGAVKQLQLRAVRSLARKLPRGSR